MRPIYILLASITMLCYGCTGATDSTLLINREASLPASLQFNEMGLTKVITSSINRKKATMSTLYGNDVAFSHAVTTEPVNYPAGSVLALVTWKQQEDQHWFGANIPGALSTVELIKITSPSPGHPAISYQQYTGNPLAPTPNTDTLQLHARIQYILGEKPSVTP